MPKPIFRNLPLKKRDALVAIALEEFACAGYERHPLRFWLPRLPSGSPAILVVEATKHWEGDDVLAVAASQIGILLTLWNSSVDAVMRPRAVVYYALKS